MQQLLMEFVHTLQNAIELYHTFRNYKAFLIYFGQAEYIADQLGEIYDYYISEQNNYPAELYREADKLIINIKAELWED